MKPGLWYVVTKASDDETFEVGDHLQVCENGDIFCREAQGWIQNSEVHEALQGAEYELDRSWLDQETQSLLSRLVHLRELSGDLHAS